MPIHVDFSQVDQPEYRVVEPGTYECYVSKVAQKLSATGAPYIEFTLQVLDGPEAGVQFRYNNSLQPQALWRFKKTLIALGYEPDQLNQPGGIDISAEDLVGCKVLAVVTNGVFNGRLRNEVVDVLRAVDSGGGVEDNQVASTGGTQEEEPPF